MRLEMLPRPVGAVCSIALDLRTTPQHLIERLRRVR